MSFDRESTRPGAAVANREPSPVLPGKQTLVDDPRIDDDPVVDLGELATVTIRAEPEPIEAEPAEVSTELQARPLLPLPRLELGATNDHEVQRDPDGNATIDGTRDDAPVLDLGELATVEVTAEPEPIEMIAAQPTAPVEDEQDAEPETTEDLRMDHVPEGRLPTNRAGQRYKPTIAGDKIGKLRVTSAFGEAGRPHSVKRAGWQIGEDGKLAKLPGGRRNLGIDYVPVGTKEIHAWFAGTVAKVIRGQKDGTRGGTGYGNRAIVKTDLFYKLDGEYRQVWCHYAHCQSVAVDEKQRVAPGTVIGIVGNTGGSHGVHVDFRTWIMAGTRKIDISPNLLTTKKSGTSKPTPTVAKPTEAKPAEPKPGRTGPLKLGANEVYREALLVAQQRTGVDAAALAALIDAEAAKTGQRWSASSRAGTSTAVGLTQFIEDTWIMMAKHPRTLLSERARAAGMVAASGKALALVPSARGALLGLRTDPLLSIVSAAEYGTMNLADMKRDGVVPDGLSDDDRAHYMYIGHHEGAAGAVIHYTDSATCTEAQASTALGNFKKGRALRQQFGTAKEAYRVFAEQFSRGKFPAQVGAKGGAIIKRYLDANNASWEHAYRAWLRDYANKKIQPDRFRG